MSNVVYYIGVKGDDHVKIGTTKNLNARLKALSTARADGDRLVVLATEAGTYELEQQRHKQFADSRGHGEWFKITPELQQHIDDLAARSTPTYVLGYDEGYQTALGDRDVVSLIHCSQCDIAGLPAYERDALDEPETICASCRSNNSGDMATLEMIYAFMSHLGVEVNAEGFRTLPPLAQARLRATSRRLPDWWGVWEQIKEEATA